MTTETRQECNARILEMYNQLSPEKQRMFVNFVLRMIMRRSPHKSTTGQPVEVARPALRIVRGEDSARR